MERQKMEKRLKVRQLQNHMPQRAEMARGSEELEHKFKENEFEKEFGNSSSCKGPLERQLATIWQGAREAQGQQTTLKEALERLELERARGWQEA